ncbi:MAG: NUDIX domain-containing protein [Spirochaetota bacterium]
MINTIMRFCPQCGREHVRWVTLKEFRCDDCDFVFFKNPAAAAAAIIEWNDEILLTVRHRDPGKGMLDLPGGFIDPKENAEDGLARELEEELGWRPPSMSYLFSFPNTYLFRGIEYHTLDMIFLITLTEKPILHANDDVAAVQWSPKAIDHSRIAFESVKNALAQYASKRT